MCTENKIQMSHESGEKEKRHKKEKILTYILMAFLVTAWGFDYVIAKHALELLQPLTLLFLKYAIGLTLVLSIKMKTDRKGIVRKKDIPVFILCSIFGEILYYLCEYSAMDYIPVSLITIVLAFVPALSIIIERILYKQKATRAMVIGVAVCIFGVALIIGVDFELLFQGRIIGYLLAFGAVFSWNAYNFLTASLHERYSSITLTCTQLICTALLTLPYAIHTMPPLQSFTPTVIGGIIYLGLVNAGVGFMITVRSLHVLGPTSTALFSNFLPVTSTFFGWLLLNESISGLQLAGGIVVIASACVVIKEKGKMEELS
ncbi:DMT family transporter [bacterium 210820-DFI.6.37]|nr:DMT family transporter [bacterium 210820-DFI.6.37]